MCLLIILIEYQCCVKNNEYDPRKYNNILDLRIWRIIIIIIIITWSIQHASFNMHECFMSKSQM